MLDGGPTLQPVALTNKLGMIGAGMGSKQIEDGFSRKIRVIMENANFYPVTGGEHNGLLQAVTTQPIQQSRYLIVVHQQTIAQRYRAGAVVSPD
jgi:hypothetical protein